MKPELWAILTAIAWSVGSILEKKGLNLGNISPIMGNTIRTATTVLLFFFLSMPFWSQLKPAGPKPILLIAIGGGVIAGGIGIASLYAALKHGQLSIVMPIAFCLTPVIGAILGFLFLHEKLSFPQIIGIILCVTGAALTLLFKNHTA